MSWYILRPKLKVSRCLLVCSVDTKRVRYGKLRSVPYTVYYVFFAAPTVYRSVSACAIEIERDRKVHETVRSCKTLAECQPLTKLYRPHVGVKYTE